LEDMAQKNELRVNISMQSWKVDLRSTTSLNLPKMGITTADATGLALNTQPAITREILK